MLRAVSEHCRARKVPVQVAVEERMACGLGVCFTCVVPIRGRDGQVRNRRACLDGPVFNGARIDWDAWGVPGGPPPDAQEGADPAGSLPPEPQPGAGSPLPPEPQPGAGSPLPPGTSGGAGSADTSDGADGSALEPTAEPTTDLPPREGTGLADDVPETDGPAAPSASPRPARDDDLWGRR
jgi:hypothetical protein